MKIKKKLEELKKEKAKVKSISNKVKKKQRRSGYEQKKFFFSFVKKSGIEADFDEINKKIFYFAISPVIITTVYLLVDFKIKNTYFSDALRFILPLWTLGILGLYVLGWAAFFLYIDYRIYNRRKEIEAVFPDYLQLVAANVNAGMPIEKSLWFAIRPRFGILAKEMEEVAKATMVGKKLPDALKVFSEKYDSVTIKRALSLVLEGIDSGSEIGDLLSRVATNMRESEIIKKEMASNVMTYVIFILFATLGAAPFLFGLTTELIVIMNSIFTNINIGDNTASLGGFGSMFSNSGESIAIGDYRIFAMTSLFISSFFAAVIISIIQKGNTKEAFKKIPVYTAISFGIYFAAYTALNLLLGGFFQ